MNKYKLFKKILASSKNVHFSDLVSLVEAFGFRLLRVKGGHHIFGHAEVREIVNLQNRQGKAIPYQVKQVLDLVEQYNLHLGEVE